MFLSYSDLPSVRPMPRMWPRMTNFAATRSAAKTTTPGRSGRVPNGTPTAYPQKIETCFQDGVDDIYQKFPGFPE